MVRLHHVNLGVLPDEVEPEMEFLQGVLGYHRVELTDREREMGAIWFEAADGSQVHLSKDPLHKPADRAHVAIEYGPELSHVEDRLREANVDFDSRQHPGFPRIVFCRDPAGNRWELRGSLI